MQVRRWHPEPTAKKTSRFFIAADRWLLGGGQMVTRRRSKSAEQGSAEQGSAEQGSAEQGSAEQGSAEQGSAD